MKICFCFKSHQPIYRRGWITCGEERRTPIHAFGRKMVVYEWVSEHKLYTFTGITRMRRMKTSKGLPFQTMSNLKIGQGSSTRSSLLNQKKNGRKMGRRAELSHGLAPGIWASEILATLKIKYLVLIAKI